MWKNGREEGCKAWILVSLKRIRNVVEDNAKKTWIYFAQNDIKEDVIKSECSVKRMKPIPKEWRQWKLAQTQGKSWKNRRERRF